MRHPIGPSRPLDGTDVVYAACVPSARLLSVSISVGTRFPAWATSMGRVLLAAFSELELQAYFDSIHLQRFTERSIGSVDQLRAEIDSARAKGWSMVSQELEEGLRGAAINVSLQTHRAPAKAIEKTVVPLLQEAARQIGNDYGSRQAGSSKAAGRR